MIFQVIVRFTSHSSRVRLTRNFFKWRSFSPTRCPILHVDTGHSQSRMPPPPQPYPWFTSWFKHRDAWGSCTAKPGSSDAWACDWRYERYYQMTHETVYSQPQTPAAFPITWKEKEKENLGKLLLISQVSPSTSLPLGSWSDRSTPIDFPLLGPSHSFQNDLSCSWNNCHLLIPSCSIHPNSTHPSTL